MQKRSLLLISFMLIVLDQLSKWLVFRFDINFGNWILGISTYNNYNFAFGLPISNILIYLISLSALIVFVLIASKLFPNRRIPQLLILVGGLLNLIERFALGYVRDYIYIFGGVFNLPDAYVLLGIIILLLSKT